MTYTVITSDSLDALIEMVDTFCQTGWRPIGGFAVTSHVVDCPEKWGAERETIFYQPMVKEEGV